MTIKVKEKKIFSQELGWPPKETGLVIKKKKKNVLKNSKLHGQYYRFNQLLCLYVDQSKANTTEISFKSGEVVL